MASCSEWYNESVQVSPFLDPPFGGSHVPSMLGDRSKEIDLPLRTRDRNPAVIEGLIMRDNDVTDKRKRFSRWKHELSDKGIDIGNVFHPDCTVKYFERPLGGNVQETAHAFRICGKAIFDMPTGAASCAANVS